MIDALASVGVNALDRTYVNLQGKKVDFQPVVPVTELRSRLPRRLALAARQKHSLIVRPWPNGNALIQLDDLTGDVVERLSSVAFLALETSPGNFQAWLALPTTEYDVDFRRLLCRGTGPDPGASGAVRIAGSINFKPERGPNFPRVRLVHTAPGLITTRAQVESLGVVAAPEPAPVTTVPPGPADLDSMMVTIGRARRRRKPRAWPDYQRCLDGAPPNRDGTGPDRSRADFTWCMIAIDWGRTVEATAERLMELSDKAQENGPEYALRTAQNAAGAVEGNQ